MSFSCVLFQRLFLFYIPFLWRGFRPTPTGAPHVVSFIEATCSAVAILPWLITLQMLLAFPVVSASYETRCESTGLENSGLVPPNPHQARPRNSKSNLTISTRIHTVPTQHIFQHNAIVFKSHSALTEIIDCYGYVSITYLPNIVHSHQ